MQQSIVDDADDYDVSSSRQRESSYQYKTNSFGGRDVLERDLRHNGSVRQLMPESAPAKHVYLSQDWKSKNQFGSPSGGLDADDSRVVQSQ